MNEKLIENITKATKAIRKKYKAIKAGIGERESILEDTFKSITAPLNSIVETNKKIKLAPLAPLQLSSSSPSPPSPSPLQTSTVNPSKPGCSTNKFKEEEEEEENDEGSEDEDIFKDAEQSFSSTPKRRTFLSKSLPLDMKQNSAYLSKKYLGYLKNESSLLDTTYGVRTVVATYGGSQNFHIGSSNFEFVNGSNDFMIDKQLYRGTPGLYQLIFLKYPKAYNKREDIIVYKQILERTNAYRRNYTPYAQIHGNRSKKYVQIISKLIPKGKGLMQIPKSKYNHIYWNDPNELVSRLQLLHASQAAGNNSHKNEILSILEELREANIID